jgi:hypothetical protein
MKKQRNLSRFEHWEENDVNLKLEVLPLATSPELEAWLAHETAIPDQHLALVDRMRQRLAHHQYIWNEIELVSNFIIPFINLVEFDSLFYRLFQEKNLRAKVREYDVHGKVDAMVASGGGEFPSQPYFFLHEYKRLKGTDADPLGQLLITMLAAQAANDIQRPIYGCFIIGVLWRFVVLAGNRYACSPTYEAVETEELHQIYALLHYVKQKVVEDIRKTYPDAE